MFAALVIQHLPKLLLLILLWANGPAWHAPDALLARAQTASDQSDAAVSSKPLDRALAQGPQNRSQRRAAPTALNKESRRANSGEPNSLWDMQNNIWSWLLRALLAATLAALVVGWRRRVRIAADLSRQDDAGPLPPLAHVGAPKILHARGERDPDAHTGIFEIRLREAGQGSAGSGSYVADNTQEVANQEVVVGHAESHASIKQQPMPAARASKSEKAPAAPSSTRATSAATTTATEALQQGANDKSKQQPVAEDDRTSASSIDKPSDARSDRPGETSRSKKRRGPLQLPSPFSGHFSGQRGETLRWRTSFDVPFYMSGHLAITNRRILAVYESTSVSLLPPRVAVKKKRHQCGIRQLTHYKRVYTPRSPFLLFAALSLPWYPFGTVAAIGCILGYALIRRPELALRVGAQQRLFPLNPTDLNNALRTLKKLTKPKPMSTRSRQQTLSDAS